MKTNIYIPIDRIEDHFTSVLVHINQYFEGSQVIVWNANGDKTVDQWIKTQAQSYDFIILKTQHSHPRSPLYTLRLAIEVSKKNNLGLLFLNPHVLVNSHIPKEIEETLKSQMRVGIIGIPTEGLNHKLSSFYKYFDFDMSKVATPSQRRIPLICTFLTSDFIEKMMLTNLAKSDDPASFYLSKLCTRLGLTKVLLSKARATQAPLTTSKKSWKKSLELLFFWRPKKYIRESVLDRYNFEIPPARYSSRL
jgi:hypothetical protein